MVVKSLRLDRAAFSVVVAAVALLLGSAIWEVKGQHSATMTMTIALYFPLVVSVVWGATALARDLETGTAEWAWTQHMTRPGWLAWRAGPMLLVNVVLASLVAVIVRFSESRWSAVVAFDHMSGTYLASHGPYFVATTVLSLAVATLVAMLSRKVVPTVGVVLVLQVVLVQLGGRFATLFASPVVDVLPTGSSEIDVTTRLGHVLSSTIAADGSYRVTYLPNSEFWTVQAWSTACLLLAAVAVAVLTLVRLRRFHAR